MTDCGDPAFLLSTQEPVECEDCSMCCDSFGRCQDQISTWFTEYTITLLSILFLLFPAVYFSYKWFPNALWIDIKAQPFHFFKEYHGKVHLLLNSDYSIFFVPCLLFGI